MRAASWATAFSPTLLSSALVIHEPMPLSSASLIHSSVPCIPPWSDGLSMMYCGFMKSSSWVFMSLAFTPMSSSSSAMGSGVSRHSFAISFHWRCLIGCSMECMSYLASCSSLSAALSGVKPPLASTRSSMLSLPKRFLMCLISSSSWLKSIAPIFSLTHANPACIFSSSRPIISSNEPIHTRPFIGMPSSPRVNGVSNMVVPPLSKLFSAVSMPKSIDGYGRIRP